MNNIERIAKLEGDGDLSNDDFISLIQTIQQDEREELFAAARRVRESCYGKGVYIRGLIEFTNICKNDCLYCGIRRGNKKAGRYRLTPEDILTCAAEGYDLGFRTFVLQGGEDVWFTKERMADIIRSLRDRFPDCAITLSVGERDAEEYLCWFEAGADRYLLRHETADERHYAVLHPAEMKLSRRIRCLLELRKIGYQIGAGFMVGSPGQKVSHLVADLRFLQSIHPHMIGIGPFLSHRDTPFANEPNGSVTCTLVLLGILRLMFPAALIPATTALGTVAEGGREQGLLAGANVLMPNLSPQNVREKYGLYDNKLYSGAESAQELDVLRQRVESVGYFIETGRGDSKAD